MLRLDRTYVQDMRKVQAGLAGVSSRCIPQLPSSEMTESTAEKTRRSLQLGPGRRGWVRLVLQSSPWNLYSSQDWW